MSRNRKRSTKADYRFFRFPWDIEGSPSWKEMKPSSCKMYISIEKRFGEAETFSLSSREAAKLTGCDKDTAASNLQELVLFGYLHVEKEATFNTAKGNFSTVFSLGRKHGWDFLQNSRVGKIPRTGPKNSDPSKMESGKHGATGPKSSDTSSCFEKPRVPKVPTHSRDLPLGGSDSGSGISPLESVKAWDFLEGVVRFIVAPMVKVDDRPVLMPMWGAVCGGVA